MGRCVGTLRDADVLISGIRAPPAEAAASDRAGFEELREVLARERQRRRDEVRAALRGHAWTKLQLYLTLWPRHRGGVLLNRICSDRISAPVPVAWSGVRKRRRSLQRACGIFLAAKADNH